MARDRKGRIVSWKKNISTQWSGKISGPVNVQSVPGNIIHLLHVLKLAVCMCILEKVIPDVSVSWMWKNGHVHRPINYGVIHCRLNEKRISTTQHPQNNQKGGR